MSPKEPKDLWEVLFLKEGTPVKYLLRVRGDGRRMYAYGYIWNFTPDGSRIGVKVVKIDGFDCEPYISRKRLEELEKWHPRKNYQ